MDIINVVTTKAGTIEDITSFPVDFTHDRAEQSKRAEIEFQKKCREESGEPLDLPLDEFLEEYGDYYEFHNGMNELIEIQIIWSHQVK